MRLEIDAEFGTAHPFYGLEGERFAVVIVGPLASTDHGQTKQIAGRKAGKAGGEAAGDGRSRRGTPAPAADGIAPPPATKPKQRWEDMRPSARAAMLTKSLEFQTFTNDPSHGVRGYEASGISEIHADEWLKSRCRIVSKAELDHDDKALMTFETVQGQFRAWQQAKGHHVI